MSWLLLLSVPSILWVLCIYVLIDNLIHEYGMRVFVGRRWILNFLLTLITLGSLASFGGYFILLLLRNLLILE